MTKLIRSLKQMPASQRHGVITIGNFDGVHIGHQQLIKEVLEKANELKSPATVLTFEPHPHEYFQRVPTARLSRLREKFYALDCCGVPAMGILHFNQTLANTSASDFLKLLTTIFAPRYMIVGDDFRFGKNREGDFNFIAQQSESLGFEVKAMQTIQLDGERVSSTRVRKALQAGDHALVSRLLNHPYYMMGKVVHGDHLGRDLGFPTANINLHRRITPIDGIYTVRVYGLAKEPLLGVASVGNRPTVKGEKGVNGSHPILEVHLLDFNQDIYGKYVRVEFCEKLRNQEIYPNLQLLSKQIAIDVENTKSYFERQHGVL